MRPSNPEEKLRKFKETFLEPGKNSGNLFSVFKTENEIIGAREKFLSGLKALKNYLEAPKAFLKVGKNSFILLFSFSSLKKFYFRALTIFFELLP